MAMRSRQSAEPDATRPATAHVVVLGNEKGGSGKSTTAMHVAVALMNVGQRVATIDLDSRQRSLTRYLENRRSWARHARIALKVPTHFCVARGSALRLDENEAIEFAGFAEAIGAVEQSHDFVVVDTPGTDSYLTRLAHSMADTLITPLNDSFVDLDVIGTVDAGTYAVTGESHYATMVRDARRHENQAAQQAPQAPPRPDACCATMRPWFATRGDSGVSSTAPAWTG